MALAEIERPRAEPDAASASDLETLTVRPGRLCGEVRVSGAKNSVLRLMVASLLTSEPLVIENYPASLADGRVQRGMLEALGKACEVSSDILTIEETHVPPAALAWPGRSIRNTLLVLAAMVARSGDGAVPLPGGCDIGERGYDLHELVLTTLGAQVWREGDRLHARSPGRLRAADVVLPLRSTGATESALLCASLADGETRIWNPHVRPEILDLIALLRSMGADIEVRGTESFIVQGRARLNGARHRAIADNMEALTWLIGAVMTQGDVTIRGFPVSDLEVPLIFLRQAGARYYVGEDTVIVRSGRCLPVEISTGPYPGINSDMQPLFAAYGACARGESRITDLRFPDRYGYRQGFEAFGVRTELASGMLKIAGGGTLRGAEVQAPDLRAGVAMMLLGLVAEGETRIGAAWQITRGYADLSAKLLALGVDHDVA